MLKLESIKIGFYHFRPNPGGFDERRVLEKILFFLRKAVGEETGDWLKSW